MCSGLKEINYQFGAGGGVRRKQAWDKTWETCIKVEGKERDDENLAVFYFMFFLQKQREWRVVSLFIWWTTLPVLETSYVQAPQLEQQKL